MNDSSDMDKARAHLDRGDRLRACVSEHAKRVILRVGDYVQTGKYARVTPAPSGPAQGEPVAASKRRTVRVLIAEDDAEYAGVIAQAIRSGIGAVVDVAGSVSCAAASAAGSYDVAVVDLDLGDGLGVEVIDHVRAANKDAQVVVMSGYLQEQLDGVVRRANAQSRFDKTDSPASLVETVRRLSASVRAATA